MKHLLVALALFGDTAWDARQETFTAITCPTWNDAQSIAAVQQAYSLASTLSRTRCLFVSFNGTRISESDDFSIGGTLYSFTTVEYEGHLVYVLNQKEEGWTA